jgi:hypothetical protein
MPSKDAHLSAARRNEATLRFLLSGADEHLAWVATVAFYKALHIIEAVFASDSALTEDHTDDHKRRNNLLKTTVRYQQLWRMYRPLFEVSLNARYLRANDNAPTHEIFERYMPRANVESTVLNHYLLQVERAASKFLGADFLK